MTLNNRKTKKWKRILWDLLFSLAVIILLCIFLLLHFRAKPNEFETTFYQVRSDKIQNQMRVVLLSDLHLHEFGEGNELLVNEISTLNPDMIAVTGDMINKGKDFSSVISLFEKLTPIAPVYYVSGNNESEEKEIEDSTFVSELTATGVNLIDDKYQEITVADNKIAICGLDYEPSSYGNWAKLVMNRFYSSDSFKLLLVHYPEYFEDTLLHEPIDLALCGHAHGGQVRLPIIGGIYSSSQGFLPKLTEGVQPITYGNIVISRGLGNSKPIPRINNPYELVVVDLNWY